jgi:hypothetical protein
MCARKTVVPPRSDQHVHRRAKVGGSLRGYRKVMREKHGAPGEIRTPDLLLRRQPLYPAELRARTFVSNIIREFFYLRFRAQNGAVDYLFGLTAKLSREIGLP